MTRLLLAFFVIYTAWLPVRAAAHALDPGYLELVPSGERTWRVTWRVPDAKGRPIPIEARLPENCTYEAPPPVFDGRAWTSNWIATCPGGLIGGSVEIVGLEMTRTDTLVRYELTPGKTQIHRLTAGQASFVVPKEAGALDVLTSYIALGVTHILEGADHLLFVFALLLLVRGWSRLFWTITAFTVAHSFTLAAASLDLLNLPPAPVEAAIALSIVFLAYELTLPPDQRDPLTERFPWMLSFAFGLIHGLGFAGALREIGLPEGDVPLALFAFNVGVELGQILFVAAVIVFGGLVKFINPGFAVAHRKLVPVSSYLIGSVAAFWAIERIAAF